jgi:TRAP-type C4-dicarboxylate transport system substrate-binding protein
MKKRLFNFGMFLLILVVLAGCASEGSSGSKSDGDVLTLRLNNSNNGTDLHSNAFTAKWVKQVEEKSGGKVKFEVFANQELVPLGEEVNSLSSGTIDIAGPFLPTYQPDQFPLSDVTMLPLLKSDTAIAQKAHADLLSSDVELQDGKTFAELEYGKHGLVVLPGMPTPEYTLGTVKDNELKTAADFKNIALRAGGRAHEIFVKELGAAPVSMTWSDEFEALSRGALDGNVRSVGDYEPYGFDEIITNSITGIAIGHFPLIWAMSEEGWKKVPEDIQKIMEEVAYDLSYESTEKVDFNLQAVENAKKKGVKFIDYSEMDASAQELITNASVNTWKAWIDAKEKEGHPGLETAKLWRDLVVKNGGSVPEEIMNLK